MVRHVAAVVVVADSSGEGAGPRDQRAGADPWRNRVEGIVEARFAFRDLRVRAAGRGVGGTVSIEVTNKGGRTGTAVPQLYLRLPGAPGCYRVFLGGSSPDIAQQATVAIGARACRGAAALD